MHPKASVTAPLVSGFVRKVAILLIFVTLMDLDQNFRNFPTTLHLSTAVTPNTISSDTPFALHLAEDTAIASPQVGISRVEPELKIAPAAKIAKPVVTEVLADLIEDYELLEPGQRERVVKDCRDEFSRKRETIAKYYSFDDLSLARGVLEQAKVEHFPTAKRFVEELLFGSHAKAQEMLRSLIRPAIIDPALKISALLETWFTRFEVFDEEDVDLLLKFAGMRKGQELMGTIDAPEAENYKIPLTRGPSIDVYRMTGISLGAQAIADFFAHSVTARTKEDMIPQRYPLYGYEALALAVAIEEACRTVGIKGPKIDRMWDGTVASWELYYSHVEPLAPLSRAA